VSVVCLCTVARAKCACFYSSLQNSPFAILSVCDIANIQIEETSVGTTVTRLFCA
jgi:hypothetical protein